jgi:hypothetical protein
MKEQKQIPEYHDQVILPLRRDHFFVPGGTGSGKTSPILVPLITQLVRGQDSAIVIIDLNGEQSQFEKARDGSRNIRRNMQRGRIGSEVLNELK